MLNLEGLILVGETNRSWWRRGGGLKPVYSLFHDDFIGVKFFYMQRYIYVQEEGPEESLFGTPESLAWQRAAMQPIG